MKAMLFSAGLGTRLRPLTNDRPKALVEIEKGKTLLHHNIEYLKSFGIKTIVVNIHHFGEKVIEEIKHHHQFGINILISDERDFLLETGGGLKKARLLLENSEAILLFNVDIISNINIHKLIEYHNSNKALATLACRNRETSRYLLFNKQSHLCGWKNINTGEEKIVQEADSFRSLAFSGIHVISPKFFDHLNEEGKFSITNSYLNAAAQKLPICSYLHDQDYWFDVGKPEKLQQAKKHLSKTKIK